MIQFILIQNRAGKARLAKWYKNYVDEEREKIVQEVYRLISSRSTKFTNFVEFRKHKLIYRRYAGLYFIFCVDINDNELAYYESIHLFVEVLDQFFGNVCELDLVFNFHRVYVIVDEMYLAGEVQETSKPMVLQRLRNIDSKD